MSAPSVSISSGPPQDAYTVKRELDGNGNPLYIGYARSSQPLPTKWLVSDSLLTSIVVLTNVGTVNKTAHGLEVGQRVKIAGATVDTDLNGSYIVATVPGVNSFTVPTVSVANDTYIESTLEVSTSAPLTNDIVWSIEKRTYSGANAQAIAARWAEGNNGHLFAWDSRANYAYQ
jgi:hypothetical protein